MSAYGFDGIVLAAACFATENWLVGVGPSVLVELQSSLSSNSREFVVVFVNLRLQTLEKSSSHLDVVGGRHSVG